MDTRICHADADAENLTRGVLDEILNLIESVSEVFLPTLGPTVTLKMGSESPKLNQLFGLSQ